MDKLDSVSKEDLLDFFGKFFNHSESVSWKCWDQLNIDLNKHFGEETAYELEQRMFSLPDEPLYKDIEEYRKSSSWTFRMSTSESTAHE